MTLGAFSLTKLGQKLGQNPNSLLEAFCHNESWRRSGVRAYVSETQLKYVQEGAEALVTTDTTEPLKARVGHISSEAEFTPKTVATQDLRTVLVYEVRLNVEDPGNRLRLGQPVTVDFAP